VRIANTLRRNWSPPGSIAVNPAGEPNQESDTETDGEPGEPKSLPTERSA
jgi:hypothetical protein